MTIAGEIALACAAGSVGTGLWAARLWYRASKVEIENPWKDGGTPSRDAAIRQAQWNTAFRTAATESSRLNARAAGWTAAAVAFTAAQTIAATIASGIP